MIIIKKVEMIVIKDDDVEIEVRFWTNTAPVSVYKDKKRLVINSLITYCAVDLIENAPGGRCNNRICTVDVPSYFIPDYSLDRARRMVLRLALTRLKYDRVTRAKIWREYLSVFSKKN